MKCTECLQFVKLGCDVFFRRLSSCECDQKVPPTADTAQSVLIEFQREHWYENLMRTQKKLGIHCNPLIATDTECSKPDCQPIKRHQSALNCPQPEKVPCAEVERERKPSERSNPNCPSIKRLYPRRQPTKCQQALNVPEMTEVPCAEMEQERKHWTDRLKSYRERHESLHSQDDQDDQDDFQRAKALYSQKRLQRESPSISAFDSVTGTRSPAQSAQNAPKHGDEISCESLHALCLAQGVQAVRNMIRDKNIGYDHDQDRELSDGGTELETDRHQKTEGTEMIEMRVAKERFDFDRRSV